MVARRNNEERERKVTAGAPSWCRAARKMASVLKRPPQFQRQLWAGKAEGGKLSAFTCCGRTAGFWSPELTIFVKTPQNYLFIKVYDQTKIKPPVIISFNVILCTATRSHSPWH